MDALTDQDRGDITAELERMRDDEERLLWSVPVSPAAKVRRDETLGRLRSERVRLERLLAVGT